MMNTKRKILTISGAAVAAAVLSGSAFADTTSSSAAHVYVNVQPNISASVLNNNVSLPEVQVGSTTADVPFRVDANQENVWLGVETTKLYKGDDPTNDAVPPLDVDTSIGATITPTNAMPTQGLSNVAVYGPLGSYNGFDSYATNFINFESSQNNDFSQDVNVHVGWLQSNPEQPQGEYSGWVILYTALQAPTDGGSSP